MRKQVRAATSPGLPLNLALTSPDLARPPLTSPDLAAPPPFQVPKIQEAELLKLREAEPTADKANVAKELIVDGAAYKARRVPPLSPSRSRAAH